jgi:hypothetical protein
MKTENNFSGSGAGGNGYAIIPLVAAETYKIAQCFKLGGREFCILDFCFLHAENVRPVIFQPWQNNVQTRTYGIDVIGCNLQSSTGPSINWRLYYHDWPIRSRLFTGIYEIAGFLWRLVNSAAYDGRFEQGDERAFDRPAQGSGATDN